MTKKPIHSVFFDLDGTLLDTAPDLVAALNKVFVNHGRPPLSLEAVLPAITQGSRAMLRCGLSLDQSERSDIKQEFLHLYKQHIAHHTRYFDGMDSVLHYLDEKSLPWGVVTNKPTALAEPLLAHFKLHHRYRCLVAGDTLEKSKPDPAPLLHACQLADVDPQQALYIGDAESDVIAAHAAGMTAIIAGYGYLQKENQPHLWNAEGIITKPMDIIAFLEEKSTIQSG